MTSLTTSLVTVKVWYLHPEDSVMRCWLSGRVVSGKIHKNPEPNLKQHDVFVRGCVFTVLMHLLLHINTCIALM